MLMKLDTLDVSSQVDYSALETTQIIKKPCTSRSQEILSGTNVAESVENTFSRIPTCWI